MIQLTKEYVQARFEELLSSPLESFEQYIAWIAELDAFESSLSRDFAHKYIAQSCNTADTKAQDEYRFFVQIIHPLWIQYGEQCGHRLIEHPDCDRLPAEYQIHIQGIRKMVELYREENIPLFVQESELTTRYNQYIASQTISYQGEELTMPQARDRLNNPDRTVRKEIFELMEQRRLQDASMIDDILSELITVRTTIARNCGFESYTDYQYSYRFDYTKEQINQFHQTIREVITPIGVHYMAQKQQKLGLDDMKPYDRERGGDESPNQLFETTEEMIEVLCQAFSHMDSMFGSFLKQMHQHQYLDLETRKHKQSGGYNYPFAGEDYSFIFMNATRDADGWFTWAHEAGHALHHYLTKKWSLQYARQYPAELAEIASMSMELFTIDQLKDRLSTEEYHQVLEKKIMGDILFLPWMSIVDLFQQWLYDHPDHTISQRKTYRNKLNEEFPCSLRKGAMELWQGEYMMYMDNFWQRQSHIVAHPFYYIEYGIAYLAAVQLYQQWQKDPQQAIASYRTILESGYTRSIPETMALGDVQFDFSVDHVQGLVQFLLDSCPYKKEEQ